MNAKKQIFLGAVVLPDAVLDGGAVLVEQGRIEAVGPQEELLGRVAGQPVDRIAAGDGYLAPGYVDLHVHGGQGADFMDATEDAFATVVRAHALHGTTSIVPTTTVATHERLLAVLELSRHFKEVGVSGGGRVLGCHFYGPYFGLAARGCHPGGPVRAPEPHEFEQYLEFADAIVTATVAPELPGAAEFVMACGERGVRTNVGHSDATFKQVADAVGWGVRHVDHLYCAMSDKTKLRREVPYPMRGGLLEATLYFDELTTEVIADGKHLSPELLHLALKIKGPDRLALVTDCNRALDMPDGEYLFGPADGGEPFIRDDDVGKMPDGTALASSVMGMDHMVRTFAHETMQPLWLTVRMASLTPARIAGWDDSIGSLEPGKRADILVLDPELRVREIYLDGARLT